MAAMHLGKDGRMLAPNGLPFGRRKRLPETSQLAVFVSRAIGPKYDV
jgi:hypothetical protein